MKENFGPRKKKELNSDLKVERRRLGMIRSIEQNDEGLERREEKRRKCLFYKNVKSRQKGLERVSMEIDSCFL
jgi:hypothetical protein